MKVKIGNKFYSAEDEPIMIILSEQDKKNISEMPDEYFKYCQYPEGKYDENVVLNWMLEE